VSLHELATLPPTNKQASDLYPRYSRCHNHLGYREYKTPIRPGYPSVERYLLLLIVQNLGRPIIDLCRVLDKKGVF
jgi:hypothetical protein